MTKVIITGPPFCGKSTLVNLLREGYPHLVIKELDEMLIETNGGNWPVDEPYRNEFLVPKVIESILLSNENFLFFTSYISPEDVLKAKEKGFRLIQLVCPRDVLIRRNAKKDEGRQYEMDRNLEYQSEIKNLKLVDKEIDCNKNLDEVLKELMDFLENKRV